VGSMRLQMDAMRVEMEAQRKAFVINVNWAARCTELKTKLDSSCGEYDQLLEQHVKVKTDMDGALRAQEEFSMKHQSALAAYSEAQDQLVTQAAEIEAKQKVGGDIARKLEELDMWEAAIEREAMQKKLGNQQALAVLQRSLAKGEDGIKTSSFSGWAAVTITEKKNKMQKDKVMARAQKQIQSSGMGLVAVVVKEWHIDVEQAKRHALMAAQARLKEQSGAAGGGSMEGRRRAIAQMEKQFKGQDLDLKQTCFQGWANGQIARKKKDQNQKKASRMIAGSTMALMECVFGGWNECTEKRRKKNREHEKNMKSAGRMIANSMKVIQLAIYAGWWEWIENLRAERKASEAGTAKAMRMMSNSSNSLMNLMFDSWGKCSKESKLKDAGNKKAMRMMSNGAQLIMIACWQGWSGARANQKSKDQNTAKAVRMINASGEALQASCFQSWIGDIRKNRDKNKKMKALEKSFAAGDNGIKMVVLTSWQGHAKVEGRKKRASEASMKTAMKSISGGSDLLLCHLLLAWCRYARQLRAEKLKEEADEKERQLVQEVEKARKAVEEDLVKAQRMVEDTTAELALSLQQRDEETGRLPGMSEQLESLASSLGDIDKQIATHTQELDQSRRKAKDIGDELGKVGIFLSSNTPRKNSRGGSRPNSGNSKTGSDALPRIDGSNSRPISGNKNGSKSARGVSGEARSGGQPPRQPSGAKDGLERRYLTDGGGPYTYSECIELHSDKGRDNAVHQWNTGSPEQVQLSQEY